MRILRKFSKPQLAIASNVHIDLVNYYVRILLRSNVIVKFQKRANGQPGVYDVYRIARDLGPIAPKCENIKQLIAQHEQRKQNNNNLKPKIKTTLPASNQVDAEPTDIGVNKYRLFAWKCNACDYDQLTIYSAMRRFGRSLSERYLMTQVQNQACARKYLDALTQTGYVRKIMLANCPHYQLINAKDGITPILRQDQLYNAATGELIRTGVNNG